MAVATKWTNIFKTISKHDGNTVELEKNKIDMQRCPRCTSGSMFRKSTGEYICVHCGCRANPSVITFC